MTLLDSLMNLCHYCLLDMVSPVSVGQPSPSSPASDSVAHTNIFTNLWHVFNPVGGGRVSFIIKLHASYSVVDLIHTGQTRYYVLIGDHESHLHYTWGGH